MDEDGKLSVAVHVEVYYGYVLPELAAQLRTAIAEALATQAGVEVSSVDVYIDGLSSRRRWRAVWLRESTSAPATA